MLAVVELGGKQYNVEVGTKFQTEKIDLAEGKTFNVENVLLVSEADGKGFKVGMPLLKDEKVEAKILSHGKGEKLRVFKMKPKKRYSKVQGHRQQYTEVEIVSIGGKKAKPVTKTKKTKTPTEAKKATKAKKDVTKAKKVDTMKSVKSKETKTAAKKTTKKAAPKKTTTTKKTTEK